MATTTKVSWIKLVVLVGAMTLLGGAAHAEDRAKAREAFRRGSVHYTLGEYKEALVEFKTAYRNFEDPSFLFNVAQCERQLGQRADAIRAYRMFLLNAPQASNREEVRQLITRLEHEVAEEQATKAAPPPGVEPSTEIDRHAPAPSPSATTAPPSAPPATAPATVAESPSVATTSTAPAAPDKPVYKRWWVWTIVGVAVAGAAVGVGVGVSYALRPQPVNPTLPEFGPGSANGATSTPTSLLLRF